MADYDGYHFRVVWEGRVVAGVSKIGGLARPTEIVEHRDGGDPSSGRRIPGRTEYEPITLERGLTHDGEFERWASKVWEVADGSGGSSLADFRRDVRIEVRDEAGHVVTAYVIHRAWVLEFNALPDLDASANAVAIESLKLENEGWERDTSVVEPAAPSTTD